MEEFFEKDILTISEVNRVAKLALEMNIPNSLCVEGEVSNITYHPSGHLYFTVKDAKANLKAVMFNYRMKGIPQDIKHGDSLRLFGKVTLYEATGQYQFLCDYLEQTSNEGDLYKKFLELKAKLEKQGYFNESRKKKLPFSTHIGVVTADQGAAIKDIISTARSRFDNVSITLFPSKVQGDDAADSIIRGIKYLDSLEDIDVIIVGRGGGSYEDLNVFNSEEIAKTIFNANKPIISAVGHEVDYTISDFVADIRAATPTHAAMLATVNKQELLNRLQSRKEAINSKVGGLVKYHSSIIEGYRKIIDGKLENRINSARITLDAIKKSYTLNNFEENIKNKHLDLINSEDSLNGIFNQLLEGNKNRLSNLIINIKNLNPMNILSRGYSATYIENLLEKKSIRSYKELSVGDIITTKLEEGYVKSKVISKTKNS